MFLKEEINWGKVHTDIEEVLGEDFWDEMKNVLPKRGPNMDVYTSKDKLVIFAEFPGIAVENYVKIKKENQTLILYGQIPYQYPFPHTQLQVSERFSGIFKRSVVIPFPFSLQNIVTFNHNGLVEIHISKE